MQDRQLIEIACIKDISLIYCRILDSNKGSKYLEIEIVYDNGQTMRLDYNDKYFAPFFNKIVKTYHIEKKKNNIVLLGKDTEEIINNYQIEESNNNNSTNDNIFPFNTNKFYIDIMSDYIKQSLKEIIQYFYIDKKIVITDLKGYRNRYLASYQVDGKKYNISLICQLIDKYNLSFEVSGINNLGIIITGSLIIKDQYIHIKWHNKNNSISGKIVADIDNGFNETVLFMDNIAISIKQENNLINEEELKIINQYLKSLNLPIYESGMKINDSNYLLYKTIVDDKFNKNCSCHFTKKDNVISILYNETIGSLKYDSKIFIPIKNSHYRFNIIKKDNIYLVQQEDLNNDNYLYSRLDNEKLEQLNTTKVKQLRGGLK